MAKEAEEKIAVRVLSLADPGCRRKHPAPLSLARVLREAGGVAKEKGWRETIERAVEDGDVATATAYAIAAVLSTHTLRTYGGADEMSWAHLTYVCHTVATFLSSKLQKGEKPTPEQLFRSTCNGLWTRVCRQLREKRIPEKGALGEIVWDVIEYFGLYFQDTPYRYIEVERNEYHPSELPPFKHYLAGAWTDGLQRKIEARDFVARLVEHHPHLRQEVEKALEGSDREIEAIARKLRPLIEKEVGV